MSERSNSGGETNNPYAAPMTAEFVSGPAVDPHTNEGDATGGLIPYKNPHALSAYYLGIISLLPLIGIPFGIASVILGVIGLRKRRANPVIKGSVHAIIGIVLGSLSLICGVLVALMFVGGLAWRAS